jgi:hypothetical protein
LFDDVTAVATPKQIRELMKVDSLTNNEVKRHLQVDSNSPLFSFQIPKRGKLAAPFHIGREKL